MLCAIHWGRVPTCPDGQNSIVHIVSDAQRVKDAGLDFVFTDGHGIMDLTSYFDNLAKLDAVDWGIMQARYWADTLDDPDRSRRRQAEFLVRDSFPFGLVTKIGVLNTKSQVQVQNLIGSSLPISVERGWYY